MPPPKNDLKLIERMSVPITFNVERRISENIEDAL